MNGWWRPVVISVGATIMLFLVGEIIISQYTRGQLQAEMKVRAEQIENLKQAFYEETRVRRQEDLSLRKRMREFEKDCRQR